MENKKTVIKCKSGPLIYWFIGAMYAILAIGCINAAFAGEPESRDWAAFAVLMLLAVGMGIMTVIIAFMGKNQLYIISEDGVVYQDFLKKQHKYAPVDIKGIRISDTPNNRYMAILTTSKILRIATSASNYQKARDFMLARYPQI